MPTLQTRCRHACRELLTPRDHAPASPAAAARPPTGKCDYFVATDGSDKNDGTDIESPFESLKCACSSKCNEELQVRMLRQTPRPGVAERAS